MKDTERTLKPRKRVIDPATTIIPFAIILTLCLFFVIKPERSTIVIGAIRGFLGNQCGLYYLVAGLGILLLSFYIAFSDIGKIKLGGKDEKPKYNFFEWGAMIFTCGLAADILFYSCCEWIYYARRQNRQITRKNHRRPCCDCSDCRYSDYIQRRYSFALCFHHDIDWGS